MKRWDFFRLFLPSMRKLRLSIYLTCVFAVLSVVAARSLYAQVREAARALGRELSGLSDLTGDAEVVLLNGARMHHVRSTTTISISAVLDRLEAHCDDNPGVLSQALQEAASRHPDIVGKHAPPGSIRRAVVREESATEGMLLCFADQRFTGLSGLSERLQRFIDTADLSEFGKVRYAYAEQRDDGTTRVVLFWTDGALNVTRMFPASGDAEGSDSSRLPRPPESRRTLSAAVEGRPYAIRVYESPSSVTQTERFYAGWMKQNGWVFAGKAEAEATSAYLSADGYQAFLSVFEERGRTHVALTEAGQRTGSSIATVELRE